MKEIKLNKGYVALVDDEDYALVAGLNWRVSVKKDKTAYAVATIKLHRMILDVRDSKVLVDHRNGHGLDCQRINLRTANSSQNQANRKKNKNGRSKYKGVQWHKASKSWLSRLTRAKKTHARYFKSELRAAVEYDVATRVLDGEFARPNFQLCPLVVQGESYRYIRP